MYLPYLHPCPWRLAAVLAVALVGVLAAAPARAEPWTMTSIFNSDSNSEDSSMTTPDGRGVSIFKSVGGFVTSSGVRGTSACVGANYSEGGHSRFVGYCRNTDAASGESWHDRFERHSDIRPGGMGRSQSAGGTGRFASLDFSCTYEVTYVEYADVGSTGIAQYTCDGDRP